MGSLIYGTGDGYEIDDRILAHLEIVIIAKLRRHESFMLNWPLPAGSRPSRVSLWLSSSIPLQFLFSEENVTWINRAWLRALTRSADGYRGMVLMPENEIAA